MKICIVVFSNLLYAPYYKVYASKLDELRVPYDIIYFDRNPNVIEEKDNVIRISLLPTRGILGKVTSRIKFVNQCKQIIKKKQYDKIIILTTVPAVLMGNFLVKHFKKKYIIDIRDFTYENISLFRYYEKKVISNSFRCFVSAPDFVKFLPRANYCLCHNMDFISIEKSSSLFSSQQFCKNRIVISYIGTISYAQQCMQLIDLVLNDNRFEFLFFGNDNTHGVIPGYIEKVNNERIKYCGSYIPSEKAEIYLQSNLIFNCYGNSLPLTKYALSNKLYEGLLYKKPLLVSPDTSMARVLGRFCFELDLDQEQSLDNLLVWYSRFDYKEYELYANEFLQNAVKDNYRALKEIQEFVMPSVNNGDNR